jgi:hypothetical protein
MAKLYNADEVLDAKHVRELFDYDKDTGVFIRRVRAGRMPAGSVAGWKCGAAPGHLYATVDGCSYKLHRLAWLYVTGAWPERAVDHANGKANDNRFSNLRLATMSQNIANAKRPKNNTSGFKGVTRNLPFTKRWRAHIKVKQRAIHLGYFDSKEQAAAAYFEAAKKYFGEFARAE